MMTAPNKAGGTIRLNDTTSHMCEDIERATGTEWEYAVSVSADGDSLLGCWTYNSDQAEVEIRWVRGSTIFIPLDAFSSTSYGRKIGLKN